MSMPMNEHKLTDLELAHAAKLKPMEEVAEMMGLTRDDIELYGAKKAKIKLEVIERRKDNPNAKYVVVTAITPTPLGEGKTTTSIGLAQGLLNIDINKIALRHVADVLDRSLRSIVQGLGGTNNGVPRESGFDITVASEVMAILALCKSVFDLRERLGKMVVAQDKSGAAVTAE